MVGLESGGNQQVVSRRQREAFCHLPHVDVGSAACLGSIVTEEVFPHMVLALWSLNKSGEKTLN